MQIGIQCVLSEEILEQFLQHISYENYNAFIPWCLRIDDTAENIPCSSRDFCVTSQQLIELASSGLWELVLQLWPKECTPEALNTYNDFAKSKCYCYLIYYDCGEFELYSKDTAFLEKSICLLNRFGVNALQEITHENMFRNIMYP